MCKFKTSVTILYFQLSYPQKIICIAYCFEILTNKLTTKILVFKVLEFISGHYRMSCCLIRIIKLKLNVEITFSIEVLCCHFNKSLYVYHTLKLNHTDNLLVV